MKRYLGRVESKKVRSKVKAIFGGTAMERFLKAGGKDVTMEQLVAYKNITVVDDAIRTVPQREIDVVGILRMRVWRSCSG